MPRRQRRTAPRPPPRGRGRERCPGSLPGAPTWLPLLASPAPRWWGPNRWCEARSPDPEWDGAQIGC